MITSMEKDLRDNFFSLPIDQFYSDRQDNQNLMCSIKNQMAFHESSKVDLTPKISVQNHKTSIKSIYNHKGFISVLKTTEIFEEGIEHRIISQRKRIIRKIVVNIDKNVKRVRQCNNVDFRKFKQKA